MSAAFLEGGQQGVRYREQSQPLPRGRRDGLGSIYCLPKQSETNRNYVKRSCCTQRRAMGHQRRVTWLPLTPGCVLSFHFRSPGLMTNAQSSPKSLPSGPVYVTLSLGSEQDCALHIQGAVVGNKFPSNFFSPKILLSCCSVTDL